MKFTFVKELFIVALLFVVIMFTLGILLYDFIPTNKALPQVVEYTADSKVTAALQEITADSDADDFEDSSSSSAILKSYTIGKDDLQNYEAKNAFESGKPDPFSDYATTPTNAVTDGNTTSSTTVTNTVTNTTTGTFFEKPNSK